MPRPAPVHPQRNRKRRGKTAEHWVADRLGGERFPANTGGPLDVKHDRWGVQVKRRTLPAWFYTALDTACNGCEDTDLIPIVVYVDVRSNRTEGFVVMSIDDFIALTTEE